VSVPAGCEKFPGKMSLSECARWQARLAALTDAELADLCEKRLSPLLDLLDGTADLADEMAERLMRSGGGPRRTA
jgi:hypothetical protein